jgi:nucleoid DNA-binding protein
VIQVISREWAAQRRFIRILASLQRLTDGLKQYTHAPSSTSTHATMTLTKRDLVTRISNETGLVQQQVLDIIQKTLDYIAESLAKGDKVELRNFGVFEVKVRKARVGRNPNAPETDVPIPARSVVKFKSGKEMRAEVLKLGSKPSPA